MWRKGTKLRTDKRESATDPSLAAAYRVAPEFPVLYVDLTENPDDPWAS